MEQSERIVNSTPHRVVIGDATLYLGDCVEVMRSLADASVDSICCDPPYHLTQASRGGHARTNNPEMPHGRHRIGDKGFMGKVWDGGDIAHRVEMWAECLRVLKPGGHLLAFSGSRTYHRMVCAIEDGGFEIRDQIMWLYGSGFPKSMNVGKAIDGAARGEPQGGAKPSSKNHGKFKGGCSDENESGRGFGAGPGAFMAESGGRDDRELVTEARQWSGWGTALKPAHEPICVARKPFKGTVAGNVLEHGTGALNIAACRVGDEVRHESFTSFAACHGNALGKPGTAEARRGTQGEPKEYVGRWPANVIHDGSPEVLEQFPDAPAQMADVSFQAGVRKTQNVYGAMNRAHEPSADRVYTDAGGTNFAMKPGARRLDSGSAARFFYCAKASRSDRNEGVGGSDTPAVETEATMRDREAADWQERNGNHHPTVKPTDLMAYLCRLVTPPGGTVLDPFMGSGSTGKAAMREGFRFIGIDMTPEYVAIAEERIKFEIERAEQERIDAARQPDMFAEVA